MYPRTDSHDLTLLWEIKVNAQVLERAGRWITAHKIYHYQQNVPQLYYLWDTLVFISNGFNYHSIGLAHKHSHRFKFLGHSYSCSDFVSKHWNSRNTMLYNLDTTTIIFSSVSMVASYADILWACHPIFLSRRTSAEAKEHSLPFVCSRSNHDCRLWTQKN